MLEMWGRWRDLIAHLMVIVRFWTEVHRITSHGPQVAGSTGVMDPVTATMIITPLPTPYSLRFGASGHMKCKKVRFSIGVSKTEFELPYKVSSFYLLLIKEVTIIFLINNLKVYFDCTHFIRLRELSCPLYSVYKQPDTLSTCDNTWWVNSSH